MVTHRRDPVGADDGGDGLDELHGAAAGVGAGVVDAADVQRLDEAVAVAGGAEIVDPVGSVAVARAHVLEAVLDELHRPVQHPAHGGGEEHVLAAALDAMASAHVQVLVDAQLVQGQPQHPGHLFLDVGGLVGGPEAHLLPGPVPSGHRAEGLQRHAGMPVPAVALLEDMLGRLEGLVHRAVGQHPLVGDVAAVLLVQHRRVRSDGVLRIHHRAEHLVLHLHQLGRASSAT